MADAWMLSGKERDHIGKREAWQVGGDLVETLVTSGLWFSIKVRFPNGVERWFNVYDRGERGWMVSR